jgi:NADH-quinone oxidoreductase subunit B
MWVMPFGTTCCAADLAAMFAPPFDLGRHGVRCIHDPALADVIVVAGRVTQALAPHLQTAFSAMARPRRVIAFGSCACSGGAYDNDEVMAADQLVTVDAFVPGCPPEPGALQAALLGLDWARRGT